MAAINSPPSADGTGQGPAERGHADGGFRDRIGARTRTPKRRSSSPTHTELRAQSIFSSQVRRLPESGLVEHLDAADGGHLLYPHMSMVASSLPRTEPSTPECAVT